jgi:uncharacterized protein (DUF58 family)
MRLLNPLLPALVVLVVLMEFIDPSPIWLGLTFILGGAWLVAYLWAKSLRNGLSVERDMRYGWSQVGDRIEERFVLKKSGILPAIWVELQDGSDLPGYELAGHATSRVTGVDGDGRNEWRTASVLTRRGQFRLGPTRLVAKDPFGIYQVETENPAQRTILVTPPVVPLPSIQITPGKRSGEGKSQMYAPELTVSTATTRPYMLGDHIRWVHWPTTARRGELFVRLLDGAPVGNWHLFVDLNQEVQVGEGWNSSEEHAIILAASLVERGLRLRRPVGLVVNAEPFFWMPARRQAMQRLNLLRCLALVRPTSRPLKELLSHLGDKLPARSTLIVITADTSGGWVKELLQQQLRGIIPTVLLIDPVTYANSPEEASGIRVDAKAVQPAAPLAKMLTRMGIQHMIIQRELLDRPESRPGQEGQWEFRMSALGRAIPLRRPVDLSWKKLA